MNFIAQPAEMAGSLPSASLLKPAAKVESMEGLIGRISSSTSTCTPAHDTRRRVRPGFRPRQSPKLDCGFHQSSASC